MWKDFFYFSKSERRAILFLLTLLFIFMCIWVLFPVKEWGIKRSDLFVAHANDVKRLAIQ